MRGPHGAGSRTEQDRLGDAGADAGLGPAPHAVDVAQPPPQPPPAGPPDGGEKRDFAHF